MDNTQMIPPGGGDKTQAFTQGGEATQMPGGDRVAFSGTSMAAPQVANLAGKILAVNPALTPPRVIEIIVSTADKTADGRRTLVNPKKALAAAQAKSG